MTSVEDEIEVTDAQMEWLKTGGRNRIERMAKRFMNVWKKAGNDGDFYVSIYLPSDILVVVKRRGSNVQIALKFHWDEIERAEATYEGLKGHYHDLEILTITNIKDYFNLEGNLTIIKLSWHGQDILWQGWDYCSTIIPAKLFPHGFLGGVLK